MQRSFDTAFKTKEHVMLLAGEVCFGTLLDGAALPTKPLEGCLSQEYSECEGFFTCSVRQIDGYHVLCAVGCSDEFALLDVNSSNRLHVIENIETIRYEAIMDTAMAKKQRRRPNSKCAPISLSINIFGQPSIAMEVGRRLSAASIFLQHPKALFKEIQYRNPQFLAFPEDTTDMRAFVGVTNDSPSARRARISDEISAILDCLSDNSLGMTIEYTQHHGLLSSLKPSQRHQVQGVCFMLQRESVRNPSLVSAETINTRDQHRGGIIADAMGLGKTLTVLTTILQSSYKAALFRDFGQEPMARTKATLVVVSSAHGYSAKLFAVTDRIRTCRSPSKHIVFSYWTSTLDLLSSLLGNGAVTHVQVDGRTSYAERSRRLQSFREDDDTSALLMSIETGALGLNLTAANYVHIVEPQWNPSVEEQAVGRALRIGQTREVTVLRYIVQGTVEQNIMHLQKKKKSVAKFMFNIGAADELDGKLEDLKFVLDLDPTAVQ
ncbi:SNF2 super family RAD5 protein [Colletotrichum camelliae]|nr:SNF2 super family RAD5 protein [Colletotrichum camelliae]